MLVCPVGPDQVDERVARLNGFFSFILLLAGYFYFPIWIYLFVDYILRAFKRKYSLTARFSQIILRSLNFESKPINAAPKKFAAQIGIFMCLLLMLAQYFDLSSFKIMVMLFFGSAQLLESIFNYCLGCEMYSLLVSLGIIKINQ